MNNWRTCTLGDLVEVKYGKDHKSLSNDKYPCFGSGGFMRSVDSFLHDDESILIPRIGSLNNIMYQNKLFWTVNTMFWTKIDKEKAHSKFLFYQLTPIDYTTLNVGSAIPSLTIPVINKIEVQLPPLQEQKAIGEVFSSLDDKIDLLHRLNKTLEAMTETLFRHYFIDNVDVDWEEGKLGDIIFISSGKSLKRAEYEDSGLYSVLGANGEIGRTNKYLYDEKLIYTGRVGTLGNIFINYGKAWLSNNTLIIKTDNESYFYFVYFLLIDANEPFHRMLTEGVKVSYQKDGVERGDLVWLVEFKDISKNEFRVVNQFTITENHNNKRPDVILFVNGLPLVVIELKNTTDENATIGSAYKQLQTYKTVIPSLFTYNSILVISDGLEARAGSISSDMSRFMSWKSADGKTKASKQVSELETLINGMLNKETLIDLIRHFIVFEKSSSIDPKTNITTVKPIKKLAAYHQYYTVNKAVSSVHIATKENEDRKGGVVWHTQGSGKYLSMVFTAGKLVLALDNPTILVITDRNDLDDQLFDTFSSSKQLLRQKPVQAKNSEHLKELLKVASGGVVFTTIQKFQPENGNVYEELSNRKNIVVIADEAHRTQYGFKAKTIDNKDESGNIIGKKVVYGFAKYMRDALPNATYLGFTGTPIEGKDINTPAVFGNYVDVYDIAQAVEDGTTVCIYYENRLAKITLSDEGKRLVEELDYDLEKQELSDTQKKAKWTQLEALIGSKDRVKRIAKDIV